MKPSATLPAGLVSPPEWGAINDPDDWDDRWVPKDKIIVHHGGGPNEAGEAPFSVEKEMHQLRRWDGFHIHSRGWRALAYSFAIGQTGTVYRVRGHNLNGAQRGDLEPDGIKENDESYAILFILGAGQEPSDAAWASFLWLKAQLEELAGRELPPWGHKDVQGGTSCPGNVYSHVVELRESDEDAPVPPVPTPPAQPLTWPEVFSQDGRDMGVHVMEMQTLLAFAGIMDPDDIDGVFGPQTKQHVQAFQLRAGLDPDGVVGPRTRIHFARMVSRRLFAPVTLPHGRVQ